MQKDHLYGGSAPRASSSTAGALSSLGRSPLRPPTMWPLAAAAKTLSALPAASSEYSEGSEASDGGSGSGSAVGFGAGPGGPVWSCQDSGSSFSTAASASSSSCHAPGLLNT